MDITEITPIQQIDKVLDFFKGDRGHVSFDHVITRLDIDGVTFNGDILRRIIEKLIRDNYVYIAVPQGANFEKYAVTFEGYIFIGYERQQTLQNEEVFRISQMEIDAKKYRDKLFWATLIAGIAAFLLLLWQVFLWINPTYSSFPYTIFGIVRK
ncbi:hypothetical protein [Mucilaginibacter sp.]|uniref:hypothetical protein n=1 Tax=Mucilaginibacter sp. TaxID=1882438 RepID=UPI002629C5E1|nr:hypothetical protein [Mucilaginibacter sp.]MDB4925889.1 hypothetical protein [Mucilaginibacter sp.]